MRAVRDDPDVGDAVALLLGRARKVPLLTAADEVALARRAEAGDAAARQRLVDANLRLVVAIARRHVGRGLPLADLVQEGAVGLIEAAARFDWRRGYRFSTYAGWLVSRAIHDALAARARPIRLPRTVLRRAAAVAAAEERLRRRHGRPPTGEELARETGLTPRQLARAQVPAVVESLDAPGDDERAPIAELLGTAPSPLEELERLTESDALRAAVARLPARQRAVIELRYAVDAGDPATVPETARALRVSPSAVRRLEERALEQLRRDSDVAALAA